MERNHLDNSELNPIIEKTQQLLNDNTEWLSRWTDYAANISYKKTFIKNIRKSFREWSPLYVYLTTTSIKNTSNSVVFDLRYMGQIVARLTGSKDGRHKLSTGYRYCEKSNLDNFGCGISLPDVDWCGDEAKKFRDFFKQRTGSRQTNIRNNDEHRLESLILTEFFKTESTNKAVLHIQPVTPIENVRFPMPTYIKASNPDNVGIGYGHIDILTRVGTGRSTNLCIMELKDENKKTEPPEYVIKQALKYATFVRELLRSNCGRDWWKLFGFHGELPEKLKLYAACVIRSGKYNNTSFGEKEIAVGKDAIVLHYLYFEEENDALKFVSTSIPGISLR